MKIKDTIKLSVDSLFKGGPAELKNLIFAYFNLKAEPQKMSSQPLFVQIEPTLYCNLQCNMCVNPLSKREKRHMGLEEFKIILQKMPFVRKISLVGAGEPLLNPQLFQMISHAVKKGIRTGFATNGMLLDAENCQKIIDCGAHWVNISIDSADKEKFEAIRKGADFNLILEGIKRLLQIRGKGTLPEASLWFVLMQDNQEELAKVIHLAKGTGIKKVFAQLEHHWNNAQLKKNIAHRGSEDFWEKLRANLSKARAAAKSLGVYFEYVNVPDTKSRRGCKWPWKSCYLTAEGFITPCCLQSANPEVINFGNVLKEDFKDIWNNLSYQKFRDFLKSDTAPQACLGCSAYYKRLKI